MLFLDFKILLHLEIKEVVLKISQIKYFSNETYFIRIIFNEKYDEVKHKSDGSMNLSNTIKSPMVWGHSGKCIGDSFHTSYTSGTVIS